MELPELTDLSAADYRDLLSFQLARYAEMFPALLGKCKLLPTCLDCSLVVVAYDAETVEALRANSVELRFEAYMILGAATLAISYENVLVYRAQTVPCQSWGEAKENSAAWKDRTKLGSNLLPKLSSMTSTTVAPLQAAKGAETTSNSAFVAQSAQSEVAKCLPVMENLSAITQRAGIDTEYAARTLKELGQFVAWNPEGYFQTTFEAWGVFSDHYAMNLKNLLGTSKQNLIPNLMPTVEVSESSNASAGSTNGAQPAKAARRTRKPAGAKTPVAKTPRKPAGAATTRFKSFNVSNKTAITIGNFLNAQRYGDEERVQIIEAIATAPETSDPTQDASLTERMIDRIMKACRQNNKRVSRSGIIKAAAEMRGGEAAAEKTDA